MGTARADEVLALLDWKRRIFELYREVRTAPAPRAAWDRWRDVRDDLFRRHSQSPLPADVRERFERLPYFAYDPDLRTVAEVVDVEPETILVAASGGGAVAFERFGRAVFPLLGTTRTLDLYWLEGYGGGVFLPFADGTSGLETYRAGRYLLDTVKGADLGAGAEGLILDFNFAYHPSCAYDPSWVCPLAPPANRLDVAIRAGERLPVGP